MAVDEEEFDWDADDFDPDAGFAAKDGDDRWEGEDEELKKEKEAEKTAQPKATTTAPAATKKSKQERIEEKKAQRRGQEISKETTPTPEDKLAEKVRLQQVQKEADLEVTKELFGVPGNPSGSIDAINPKTPEEFDELLQLLKSKLNSLATSPHYVAFMENLMRGVCAGLDSEDLRKMSGLFSAMALEKSKAAKAAKTKKKGGGKVSIAIGKASKKADLSAFGDYDEDGADMDDTFDFM